MSIHRMKRREFIATLGSAAAWPLVARAQQPSQVRHIGLLLGVAEEQDPESQARIEAFRGGLAALGWIEGQNIKIDYRFGGGDADRIKTYATELVNSGPDLIVANSTPAVAALKRATQTIPVVFAVVSDPVGQGLIANLAHPGGNITGFTLIDFEMVGKWYEMLKEMTPGIKRAMLIFNPETAPEGDWPPGSAAATRPRRRGDRMRKREFITGAMLGWRHSHSYAGNLCLREPTNEQWAQI